MGAVRVSVVLAGLATAVALVLFGPPNPVPRRTHAPAQVTVVRVIDGDTLEVELRPGDREEVRLIGIDTPETVRPDTPVECGGPAGSRRLDVYAHQRVLLQADPSQDGRDRYGRLLRYVTGEAGEDIGRAQLAAGAATVYVYERPFARLDSYEHAQNEARDAGRGAWSTCAGDFHRPLPTGG
jgi:micrococcal nuclease